MKEKDNAIVCPHCGAIRVNVGETKDGETHFFCRKCETEFTLPLGNNRYYRNRQLEFLTTR